MNEHESVEQSMHIKLPIEIGALVFDIELDNGFFRSSDYRWGQELSHNHAAYEVHLVQQGSCVMYVEDSYHELEEGCLCIIPPGTYHSQLADKPGTVTKMCFRFSYRQASYNRLNFAIQETKELVRVLDALSFCRLEDLTGLMSLAASIHHELNTQSLGYLAKIQSLFAQLMIDMIRTAAHASTAAYELPVPTPDDRRTAIIDLYFSYHYSCDVKEEDLARQLNVSTRQLNRILNELYRTSFRRKLLDTRMKVAMDLLKNTGLSIQDVAERVGYQTTGNFHAAFKTHIGVTPSAFRLGQSASASHKRK